MSLTNEQMFAALARTIACFKVKQEESNKLAEYHAKTLIELNERNIDIENLHKIMNERNDGSL